MRSKMAQICDELTLWQCPKLEFHKHVHTKCKRHYLYLVYQITYIFHLFVYGANREVQPNKLFIFLHNLQNWFQIEILSQSNHVHNSSFNYLNLNCETMLNFFTWSNLHFLEIKSIIVSKLFSQMAGICLPVILVRAYHPFIKSQWVFDDFIYSTTPPQGLKIEKEFLKPEHKQLIPSPR